MNPTRLLGALALAAGGSLLLSEPLIGHDLFVEMTGTGLTHLRLVCIVAVLLGGFAVGLGVREEHEFHNLERRDKKRKHTVGLIIPVGMILFGTYALLVTLNSNGEQVALISGHVLPRELVMVFSLLGLGGGTVIMFGALSSRKYTA